MTRRLTFTFLVLSAVALGTSSCKEDPAPQGNIAVKELNKENTEPEPPVIGRITFIERNLFRYLRDAKDWALAMVDVPVSDGDILYSDAQGRSELTFPNDTKIRLNDKTKVQLDGLTGTSTALFVNSGIARFHNGDAGTTVKVDTPYGQVLSKQPGTFDVYVGDSSVAVTAFKQPVRFVDRKGTQYEVRPDAKSLLANEKMVVSTSRFVNSSWDTWNNERDQELQVREVNPSPYLPAQLQSESLNLEDNGNWEQISYGGESAHYWTPRYVSPDWSPFTVGQWTNWNGEQLWVPYERFGWVTHHHGGWIYHNRRWYWRPPVAGRWRYVPWYPARVAWIDSGRHIGWVPISPYEVYYGRRYWGPRSVVYTENIRNVEIRKYVNVNRVVVVEKDRLYSVHRKYESTRDPQLVKAVVNNGHAAPVVTREIMQGTNTQLDHHFARTGDFSRKPNVDAVSELATRRRGVGSGAVNAQAPGTAVERVNIKSSGDQRGQVAESAKTGNGTKRNLPSSPGDLRREQGVERRLEANTARGIKERPGQAGQQPQKQPQVAERQQQRIQQDAQQRRQQQFERHQQQQLTQDQQRAHRQQQAQRQQQMQAQQQAQRQQQALAQQQQAQRQQHIQAQQQQVQQQQQQAVQRQHQQKNPQAIAK